MSMDEYKLMDSADTDLTDELSDQIESMSTNNKKRENTILDLPQEITEDMTIKELLTNKGLTLKDLGAIISQFNSGKKMDVTQSVKFNENRGEREAKVFASKKGKPVYVKKRTAIENGYIKIKHYFLTYKEPCSM